jgi:hypothetical protein
MKKTIMDINLLFLFVTLRYRINQSQIVLFYNLIFLAFAQTLV